MTPDPRAVEALTDELDRHWMQVQRDHAGLVSSVFCSCGEWQYDLAASTPLTLGDRFRPFSEHVATVLAPPHAHASTGAIIALALRDRR